MELEVEIKLDSQSLALDMQDSHTNKKWRDGSLDIHLFTEIYFCGEIGSFGIVTIEIWCWKFGTDSNGKSCFQEGIGIDSKKAGFAQTYNSDNYPWKSGKLQLSKVLRHTSDGIYFSHNGLNNLLLFAS